MYPKERQEKIEELVFDAIEEIAEEFDLSVPFYPHVYCLNKSTDFKSSGLPDYFKPNFSLIKKSFDAAFIEEPCSIVLGLKPFESAHCEEATHFVHHVNSGIIRKKRKNQKGEFIFCLSEMLGYFGSMILGEERTNQYNLWPDPYSEPEEFNKFLKELRKKYHQPTFLIDQLIHQQG